MKRVRGAPRKIFTALCGTETNSYSPIPTSIDLFSSSLMVHGGAPWSSTEQSHLFALPLGVWRRRAEAVGWEVVEGMAAFACPAGETTAQAFAELRDEILNDLRRALPVDAVLLNLHGAMVAEGAPDAEGQLLREVRSMVGPDVPLLAELDLHGHLTESKLAAADVLIFYKEYPHTCVRVLTPRHLGPYPRLPPRAIRRDVEDRAHELFNIAERMVDNGLVPTMARHDCRMLGLYPTTREPLRSFVARMKDDYEKRPGVLSVSLVHGFPWSDSPEVGTFALAVTEADEALASRIALEMGDWVWANRKEILLPSVAPDVAIEAIVCAPPAGELGPLVLADTADNAGGGAASDSTFLLHSLLERLPESGSVAVSPLWDPSTVDLAFAAGLGATFDVRIGGKLGPASGPPLDARVTVKGLRRNAQQPFGSAIDDLGDVAWLRIGDADDDAAALDVICNSKRTQAFHPDCFAQAGLDPNRRRALIVKSAQHFNAGFGTMAREVMWVATPGSVSVDFAAIYRQHKRVSRTMWPDTANPHSAQGNNRGRGA
jgi:microcystin degradation protein MlrC